MRSGWTGAWGWLGGHLPAGAVRTTPVWGPRAGGLGQFARRHPCGRLLGRFGAGPHLGSDVGVAVSVAAHPGAKADGAGVDGQLPPGVLLQRGGDAAQQLGQGGPQRLLHDVQPATSLCGARRRGGGGGGVAPTPGWWARTHGQIMAKLFTWQPVTAAMTHGPHKAGQQRQTAVQLGRKQPGGPAHRPAASACGGAAHLSARAR